MMQDFVYDGILMTSSLMKFCIGFGGIFGLLGICCIVSIKLNNNCKRDRIEGFYYFLVSSLFCLLFGFGFYKSLQGYNYYQNIAKHDSISKHFDITKDEDLLILNRKGVDNNIKKSAVLVIVSEDDNNYHVKYNDDTVYVISKRDKDKTPYKLVK